MKELHWLQFLGTVTVFTKEAYRLQTFHNLKHIVSKFRIMQFIVIKGTRGVIGRFSLLYFF